MVVALIGCTAADPIDQNIYTQSVMPGSTGDYDIGADSERYEYGYFDYVDVSENIEADGNIHAAGDLYIDSDVDISGDIIIDGDLEVDDITADNITGNELNVPHADTHSLNGTDILDIHDLQMYNVGQKYSAAGHVWHYILTQTGGRGGGGVSFTGIQAVTGWVANDVVGWMIGSAQWFSPTDIDYWWRLSGQFRFSENTTHEAWVGYFDSTGDYPSNTDNHTGFKLVNGELYASSGNGTHGTQTLVATSLPSWHTIPIGIKYYDSKIDYYTNLSTTPVVTHTTTIPKDVSLYHGLWGKTTDGTVHQSWLLGFQIMSGG